jgi:dihydroorotate dehydrogenase electron transfer subunit
MKQFLSRVHANEEIACGYFEMTFEWDSGAEPPLPGQFVTVKSYGTTDLILRRPFAVSSFDGETARAAMIYQKKGPATEALAGKRAGDTIDLIAPLGNPFPVDAGIRPILVGGGVGLGPILYLGNWLEARGRKPLVVLGFRERSLLPSLLDDRSRVLFTPELCSDDGSRGFRGTTVGWLGRRYDENASSFREGAIFMCGPNAMMAACAAFAAERGIPSWASMEQIMGCGVGACMGCTIPVGGADSYARVCTEGPVFRSEEVQWERLA